MQICQKIAEVQKITHGGVLQERRGSVGTWEWMGRGLVGRWEKRGLMGFKGRKKNMVQ